MATTGKLEEISPAQSAAQFSMWHATLARDLATWTKAPYKLKSALLLKGAMLVKAEQVMLVSPEKLTSREKQYVVQSLAQATSKGEAHVPRPPLRRSKVRYRPLLLLSAASMVLVVGLVAVPLLLKSSLELAINRGLTPDDIEDVRRIAADEGRGRGRTARAGAAAVSSRPQIAARAPATYPSGEVRPEIVPEVILSRRILDEARRRAQDGDRRTSLLLAIESLLSSAPSWVRRERETTDALSVMYASLARVEAPAPVPASRAPGPAIRSWACPDGRIVEAAAAAGGAMTLAVHGTDKTLLSLARRPELLATIEVDGRCAKAAVADEDQVVEVWSLDTGRRLAAFTGHEATPLAARFSADGRWLLTGAEDNTARLWPLDKTGRARVLEGHDGGVTTLALSPDGRRVATGSSDHTARIWDVATGALVRVLDGAQGAVTAVAFSPDGRQVLVTSVDGFARLADLEAGTTQLVHLEGTSILWAGFSPDGRRLAAVASDGRVLVWSIEKGAPEVTLAGHGAELAGLAFSRRGDWVSTTSRRGEVMLWRADSGRAIARLTSPAEAAVAVRFADDASAVRVSMRDGSVRSWPLFHRLADVVRAARERAGACLAKDEREALALDAKSPDWCSGGGLAIDEVWDAGEVGNGRRASLD